MAFPNVIIAGAPKSGTSSLFFWLTAHPDVCGSRVKETYFLHDKVSKHNEALNYVTHGFESYQNCFPDFKGEKVVVEATAPYIYQETPLVVAPKLPEKPKVIFILRNPAERIYSHFKFNKFRMNNMPKSMSFKEYIEVRGKGINMEDYIQHSIYHFYIEKFINVLGANNVKVYLFEDLIRDKVSFMKKVALDIGLDDTFYNDFDFFKRNETVSIKNKWLHNLGLKLEPLFPQFLQEKVFIPLYLKINGSKVPPKSEDEKLEIIKLKKFFEPYNQKLKKHFPELNIDIWNA
jgi:hypothetical protein